MENHCDLPPLVCVDIARRAMFVGVLLAMSNCGMDDGWESFTGNLPPPHTPNGEMR